MKRFAELYAALDETTKTNEKVQAIAAYLMRSSADDAAWAIHFLIGRRPKRLIPVRELVAWAVEESGVPEWMFGESYQAVGDLAETIALLLPPPTASTELPLHYWVEHRLLAMRDWDDAQRRESMINAWREMDERQRFVWNKLITGEFRVGVSQNLVVRALAKVSGIDPNVIAHRLMGEWQPTPSFHQQLIAPDAADADVSKPYPFCQQLADRVEVGRHPGAAYPEEVADFLVVARRRANHTAFP
jgi:DNA ligase-1